MLKRNGNVNKNFRGKYHNVLLFLQAQFFPTGVRNFSTFSFLRGHFLAFCNYVWDIKGKKIYKKKKKKINKYKKKGKTYTHVIKNFHRTNQYNLFKNYSRDLK